MPTETEVVDQLEQYFGWLEQELGVSMHRGRVVMPAPRPSEERPAAEIVASPSLIDSRPRRGLGIALAAVTVAAIAGGGVYLATGTSHDRRLSPAPIDTSAETSPSSTVTEVRQSTTYAPLALPNGLVVWDVGAIVIERPVMTQQLFGTYGPENTMDHALLVQVQPATSDNGPPSSVPTISVRGVEAGNLAAAGADPAVSLQWVEDGFVINAYGTIPTSEAVTMIDRLRWRSDPSLGFDPATSTLPLVSEDSSITHPSSTGLVFYITGQGGPSDAKATTSLTDRIDVPGEASLIVSDVPAMGFTPELLMNGVRQSDGSISVDLEQAKEAATSPYRIEPDGTVIRFAGDRALWPQIVTALQPATNSDVSALASAANQRLLQLDELASTPSAATQVILRGRTSNPSTICLRIDGDERCRSTRAQQQGAAWSTVVEFGSRWFMIGRQSASEPSPVIFPWHYRQDATPDQAIQAALATVVGDDLLWYAEVPPNVDAIASGHITSQGAIVDIVGRPTSSGAIWSAWTRLPQSTAAPGNDGVVVTAEPGTGDRSTVVVSADEPGRVHPEVGAYVLQPNEIFPANIASKFHVPLDELLAINGWTVDANGFVAGYPPPGSTIKLPPGWTEPGAESPATAASG